jgi:predicted dehydrogenase
MASLSRREFLQGTAALAGAWTSTGMFGNVVEAGQETTRRRGPNDQLHVAVIGVHGRGRDHVRGLAGRHNCLVTHVCDPDTAVVRPAITAAERAQGRQPTFVQDLRRIMDDPSIDIVTIATPNHWHSLAAIWAMQAGKDVYVEKPVSHNVTEGRRVVDAARRYNKICQAGTQIRSNPGIRRAIEFLQSGQLGRIQVARGLCYKPRGSIGRVSGEQPLPATINYNLWCGPAPVTPLHRRNLHYDWHWVWDYGNGDLGNQGIHQMDVARWGLGRNEMCRAVVSAGGRFGYVDDGETANTQLCVFDYGDSELIFEVRGLNTPAFRGASVGNVFHCADGYMVFPSYGTAIAYGRDGQVIQRWTGNGDHYGNFVQAVRNRRQQDLNGDIQEGHLSSALCHLGNISYRLGRDQAFNGRSDVFNGDREANETMERTREHLRANQVSLEGSFRMGRRLTLDPANERFRNDDEANRMLTREYRAGFAVPARI